jgi:hypothetical protein
LQPRRQWKLNYGLLLVWYMRAASVFYCPSRAERLQNLVFFFSTLGRVYKSTQRDTTLSNFCIYVCTRVTNFSIQIVRTFAPMSLLDL